MPKISLRCQNELPAFFKDNRPVFKGANAHFDARKVNEDADHAPACGSRQGADMTDNSQRVP